MVAQRVVRAALLSLLLTRLPFSLRELFTLFNLLLTYYVYPYVSADPSLKRHHHALPCSGGQ